MIAFSEFTSTLRVTKYKINIVDLDYIKLSSQFKPAGDVVAINSNFVHICLDGYSRFLTKPKPKPKPACSVSPSARGAYSKASYSKPKNVVVCMLVIVLGP